MGCNWYFLDTNCNRSLRTGKERWGKKVLKNHVTKQILKETTKKINPGETISELGRNLTGKLQEELSSGFNRARETKKTLVGRIEKAAGRPSRKDQKVGGDAVGEGVKD